MVKNCLASPTKCFAPDDRPVATGVATHSQAPHGGRSGRSCVESDLVDGIISRCGTVSGLHVASVGAEALTLGRARCEDEGAVPRDDAGPCPLVAPLPEDRGYAVAEDKALVSPPTLTDWYTDSDSVGEAGCDAIVVRSLSDAGQFATGSACPDDPDFKMFTGEHQMRHI